MRPAGTLGGDVLPDPNVWNVATTAYQSVAVLNVARASCAPAALDRMSSRLADWPLVCVSMVKFWPCEDPAVTVPGEPPVMIPPTTSSPAPTEPVGPESTAVLLPLADRELVDGAGSWPRRCTRRRRLPGTSRSRPRS